MDNVTVVKGAGYEEDGIERIDEDERQSYVSAALADAKKFIDVELSPDRAKASKYYRGDLFGNEEEGRSQFVLTEVRDGILAILPSLLRMFFGGEGVVEFTPKGPKQEALAKTATRYVNYVFTEDNPGFMLTHAVLKDACTKRIGAFKWAWEPAPPRVYRLKDVPQDQIDLLELNEDLTIRSKTPVADPSKDDEEAAEGTADADYESPAEDQAEGGEATENGPPNEEAAEAAAPTPGSQPPNGPPQAPAPLQYFDIEVVQRMPGRAVVYALPPEELLYSREGRDIDTIGLIAHRTEKRRGELLAMGITQEQLDEHDARDLSLRLNAESIDRQNVQSTMGLTDVPTGKANDKLAFVDAYIMLDEQDENGEDKPDGIPELRHIWTIGNTDFIVKDEAANDRPFALFCPDPEPHTLTGQSWADRLMDLQLTKSTLLRSMFDSLSASIYARMAYQEGAVNTQDVMNTGIGAPIRVKKGVDVQQAIQSFTHVFAGKEGQPLLQYMDDIARRRTGKDDGAASVDANTLQSSTETGVTAALSFSQEQVELVARIFAEMTYKRLFKGILGLLVEHQCEPRTVKIRGEWIEIDPSEWDDTMDVSINVALGTAFVDKKIQTLMSTYAEQKDLLTTLGPANPMVSVGQLRNTAAMILELQGYKDATPFFKPVDPNWAPPPTPPQPSPEQIAAQTQLQVEQIKAQVSTQNHQLTTQQKHEATLLENERLTIQNAAANELARYELELKYHAKITGDQLDADANREVAAVEAALGVHEAVHGAAQGAHDQELAAQGQEHDQALAADQQQHEQDNPPEVNQTPAAGGGA